MLGKSCTRSQKSWELGPMQRKSHLKNYTKSLWVHPRSREKFPPQKKVPRPPLHLDGPLKNNLVLEQVAEAERGLYGLVTTPRPLTSHRRGFDPLSQTTWRRVKRRSITSVQFSKNRGLNPSLRKPEPFKKLRPQRIDI
jgi:hypothetical protein